MNRAVPWRVIKTDIRLKTDTEAEDAAKQVSGVRTVAQDLSVKGVGEHKRSDFENAEIVLRARKWNVFVPLTPGSPASGRDDEVVRIPVHRWRNVMRRKRLPRSQAKEEAARRHRGEIAVGTVGVLGGAGMGAIAGGPPGALAGALLGAAAGAVTAWSAEANAVDVSTEPAFHR